MATNGGGALLRRVTALGACMLGRGWPGAAADVIEDASLGADLTEEDIEGPLDELLRACAEEAELSMVGRVGLRWDMLRLLRNLARLRAEEARAPAILREQIAAPLVITGLPRTGSTFLHRLLAADPATVTPLCWQTIYPYPDPRERTDRRAVRVEGQFRQFAWLASELQSLHPLDSCAPQECTEITSQVFQSLRFETVYHVPRYKAWLRRRGHAAAYRFHRRFLQHLQHQGQRGRWVLKCPDHVFALDALRAVYPDARVVFLHRDPLHVLPSVAQLTEILRAPFTRRLDRREIGRAVVEDWVHGAALMLREARAPTFPPAQVLHLHYREVARQPIETVELLYRHFDLALAPAALAAMRALVAARPRGGYGENRYSFATHGIDPEDVRKRFADYVDMFGVASELAPSRGAQALPAHADR